MSFKIEARFKEDLSPTLKGELVKLLIGAMLEADLGERLEELVVDVGGREVLIKTLDEE